MGQPIALESVVFRLGAEPRLAVIAKITFDISHQGAAVTEPIGLHDDVHHDGNEGRSLLFASDRVPRKGGRCDVLFVGAAYAPVGQRVTHMGIRLRVSELNHVLVDKRLDLSTEEPFDALPLRWELAAGGDHNPYGSSTPILVVADPESGATPGLGPLTRATRPALVPAASLPAEFDFEAYQVAPADQRIRPLTGHEELLLVGLHPHLPEVRSRLPGVVVQAKVGIDGTEVDLPLIADTMVVFGDTLGCTVTFRGDLAVSEEVFADPSRAVVAARFVEVARKLPPRVKQFASTQVTVGAALPPLPMGAPAPGPSAPAPAEEGERQTMVLDQLPAAFAVPPSSSVPRKPKNPLAATQEAVSPVVAFEAQKQAQLAASAAPTPEATPAVAQTGALGPRKKAFVATLEAGTGTAFAWPTVQLPAARDGDEPRDPEERFVLPPEPPRVAIPVPLMDAPEIEILEAYEDEEEAPLSPVRSSLPPSVIASSAPPESHIQVPTLPPLRPPPRTTEQLPLIDLGKWTAWSFPYQLDPPEDSRVVVVKLTADLVPNGRARLADEPLPPSGDAHWDDDPEASLRYATDFAPFKPRADALLVGHVPDSSKKGVALVQFRLGKEVSRKIAVFGDRTWERGVGTTAPFDAVPLRWERALGGPLSEQNPLGMGYRTGVRIPNLEDFDVRLRGATDTTAPACTAPTSPSFPHRRGKLGTYGRKWQESRWPYFPEDFDWAFYNAAPPGQQLEYLTGNESYLLAGVGKHALVEGQLPAERPRAFALRTEAQGGGLFEVVLRLDTVWFDADAGQVVLVWRGFFAADDDEATNVSTLLVMPDAPGLDLDGARAALHRELFTRGLLSTRVEADDAPPENENAGAGASLGDLYRQMAAKVEAAQKAKRTPAAAPPSSVAPVEAPRPLPEIDRETLARHLEAARNGASLAGKDLSWVKLDGEDLRGLDLSGVILTGARLRNARLDDAKLNAAVLAEVDAEGASFARASLVGTDLTQARLVDADLTDALLDDAVLDGIHAPRLVLDGVRGERTKLVRANLVGAHGEKVCLHDADFTDAVIEGLRLVGADLARARLYDAEGMDVCLDEADLEGLRADGARLRRGRFLRVKGAGAVFAGAELELADFSSASLEGADFAGAHLSEAVLDRAELVGARFRKAEARRALLRKANLMQANFEKADLTGADLRGANLFECNTYRARAAGVRLDLALVAGTRLGKR